MVNKIGYIFNKYEIVYIAEIMGATFITDIGININETAEVIIDKAKKSLINKNYVFRDFNGELVLNKEFVDYFMPFVLPSGLIACRMFQNDTEKNLILFTKDKNWLCVENDISNSDNYILTYSDEYVFVRDYLKDVVQIGQRKISSLKIIMNAIQYRMLKDMVKKKDRKGLISVLNMLDIQKNDELISEIESICSENANVISLVFFRDYKKNINDMECLLYYPTDNYIWKINVGEDESMRISCVSEDDVQNDIINMLSIKFGITVEKTDNQFL